MTQAKLQNAAEVYLRFLRLSEAIREMPSLPPLDPLEERILAQVGLAASAGQRLSVRDMMSRHDLGAPATIHTRLKTMRAKGWIELEETEDPRRKQVALTPVALRYFGHLSKAMLRVTRIP